MCHIHFGTLHKFTDESWTGTRYRPKILLCHALHKVQSQASLKVQLRCASQQRHSEHPSCSPLGTKIWFLGRPSFRNIPRPGYCSPRRDAESDVVYLRSLDATVTSVYCARLSRHGREFRVPRFTVSRIRGSVCGVTRPDKACSGQSSSASVSSLLLQHIIKFEDNLYTDVETSSGKGLVPDR
jgi:hypothetical protein